MAWQITRAVLGGDRDAFRVLIDREAADLVRTCYRVLGDRHEAEDVAQEAFVTAYRALATWRGDGPFGAWLARIGVRIALRRVARRRNVTFVRPDDAAMERALEGATSSTSSRAAEDPAARLARTEDINALRTALARLDEPYREVVTLRFLAERSLVEIAESTGRPLGTVKTHLHRGLLRLRAILAEETDS